MQWVKSKYNIGLMVYLLLSAIQLQAQSENKLALQASYDSLIQYQADSLKKHLQKEGFELLREASVAMTSEYDLPIVLPLRAGIWYHIVFIGNKTSNLFEVRVFDFQEKQVVFKQHRWGDVDGPIIRFSYIPQQTERHLIRAVQVNKQQKSGLTGYFMLWRKE